MLADGSRENDLAVRKEKAQEFVKIVEEERPAAFLYAPEFIYAVPQDLLGIRIGSLTTPSERFLNVYEWHQETEHVWDVFIPEEQIVTTY